jgi:hypothetical protein
MEAGQKRSKPEKFGLAVTLSLKRPFRHSKKRGSEHEKSLVNALLIIAKHLWRIGKRNVRVSLTKRRNFVGRCFFVNSGHKDMAIEFTKENSHRRNLVWQSNAVIEETLQNILRKEVV